MKKMMAVALIAAALIAIVIMPAGAELTSEEQSIYDSKPIKCPECGQQICDTDGDGNKIPLAWKDVKGNVNYDTADSYTHYCDNCQTDVTFHFWACKYSSCHICLPTNPGDVCPNCHAYQVIPADIQELIYGAGDAENSYYAGTVQGYEKGKAAATDGGYEAGYNAGYEAGFSAGGGSSGETGDTSGKTYEEGFNAGYQEAMSTLEADTSNNVWYNKGFDAGKDIGYKEGYKSGYDAGRQKGYEEGYLAGYQKAIQDAADKYQYGVFTNCEFRAKIAFQDAHGNSKTQTTSKIAMSYGYGYVYIGKKAMEQIQTACTGLGINYEEMDYIEIESTFGIPFDFQAMPLYITKNSNITTLQISDENGNKLTCTAESETESRGYKKFLLPSGQNTPFHCTSATLYIPKPKENLQAFSFYSPTGEYFKGYDVGYADGSNKTAEDARQEGYKSGYTNGVIDGKKEGISISNSGEFGNLIAAVVEAPVNTFQSMFNFEILGMNMQKAIGAVLALCVVAIIIKKVVL